MKDKGMIKVPSNVKIEKHPMGNYLVVFSCKRSNEKYSFMLDPMSALRFAEALLDNTKRDLDVELNKLS